MGALLSVDDDDLAVDDAAPHFVADARARERGLKILCLHGRAANNDITAMQLRSLLLRDVHGLTCDMFQATDETIGGDPALMPFTDQPFLSWFNIIWFNNGPMGVGKEGGSLHTSLLRIMRLIEKRGPYDGIYGFSQGGALATLLCSRVVWNGLCGLDACPFKFAMIANSALGASWLSTCEIATLGCPSLPIPASDVASFHVIGSKDKIRDDSKSISQACDDRVVYHTPVGHELPGTLQLEQQLHYALEQFLDRFVPEGNAPRKGAYAKWMQMRDASNLW